MHMCVVWYTHLFCVLRENKFCAHDITYTAHFEKSLCFDNDPRCYPCEMKIISSEWIALLRRLLIYCNTFSFSHLLTGPEWRCQYQQVFRRSYVVGVGSTRCVTELSNVNYSLKMSKLWIWIKTYDSTFKVNTWQVVTSTFTVNAAMNRNKSPCLVTGWFSDMHSSVILSSVPNRLDPFILSC